LLLASLRLVKQVVALEFGWHREGEKGRSRAFGRVLRAAGCGQLFRARTLTDSTRVNAAHSQLPSGGTSNPTL
jgi:hypothetical protein